MILATRVCKFCCSFIYPWPLWSWWSALSLFMFRCFLSLVKTLPSSSSSGQPTKCGVKTFWCFILSGVLKNIHLEKYFSCTIGLRNRFGFALGFCLWKLRNMVRRLTTLALNYYHSKLGKLRSFMFSFRKHHWK